MKITFFPEIEEDNNQAKRSPIGVLVNFDPGDEDKKDQGISFKIGDKEIENSFLRAIAVFITLIIVAIIMAFIAVLLPLIMLVISIVLVIVAAILIIAAFIAPFLVLFGLGKGKITLD